jgi:O-antigen polymerase
MGRLFSIAYFIVIILLVIGSLMFSDFFIYKSQTPYYTFLILGLLIGISAGILLILKKKNRPRLSYFTLFFVFLFFIYICYNGLYVTDCLNNKHWYLLIALITFVGIYVYATAYTNAIKPLFVILLFVCLLETLYCIGQFLGILDTLNNFFSITGTWGNPNVTALFLSLSFPLLFVPTITTRYKSFLIICKWIIGLLLLGILLLIKCRSAYIGLIVSCSIIFWYKYNLKQHFNKKNKVLAFLLCATIMAIVFFVKLYESKKESADGRLLIWKLSVQMVCDKPLNGFGYGQFEREYNIRQAAYFAGGHGTPNEVLHADHINMAYCEPLENAVESGIVGCFFYLGFLIALIVGGIKAINQQIVSQQEKGLHSIPYPLVVSVSGVSAIAVISTINFVEQAIPVMVLLLIYSAVICSYFTPKDSLKYPKLFLGGLGFVLCTLSISFLIAIIPIFCAQLDNKRGYRLVGQQKIAEAICILEPLNGKLAAYESYRNNMARAYLVNGQFQKSIYEFEEALKFTSSIESYMDLGYCYLRTGQYQQAERVYNTGANIRPTYLYPRFTLLNLYQTINDTSKIRLMANVIINMPVKIQNNKSHYYKQQAQLALNKLNSIK